MGNRSSNLRWGWSTVARQWFRKNRGNVYPQTSKRQAARAAKQFAKAQAKAKQG